MLVSVLTLGGNAIPSMAEGENPASQTGGASVSLLPMQSYVETGQACTLQVYVHPTGDSLSCMECWITFDPSLVDFVRVEEGRLFKESGYLTFLDWQFLAPDTAYAIDCVMGYQTYFLSPGELARFVFEAKQSGVCPVRIARMRLWDIDRVELPVMVDPNAWIYVDLPSGMPSPRPRKEGLTSHPNPFTNSTVLTLGPLGRDESIAGSVITVRIYSASGHRIAILHEGKTWADRLRVAWDGLDDRSRGVPSGVYIAVAETQRGVFRTKLVLIR
jgi:hypothetical protein